MQYIFRSKPCLLAGEKGESGVMAQGFSVGVNCLFRRSNQPVAYADAGML
jgi:hypothetical protein